MSDAPVSESSFAGATREDELAALFAHLVIQQSNMAMMLMGKVAHPETGQTTQDIDAARLFIDQLEMLQVKTKGNLTKQEEGLLKQSLMALRMAFVEAVESPAPESESQPQQTARPTQPAEAAEASKTISTPDSAASDEEHRKKFTKKY